MKTTTLETSHRGQAVHITRHYSDNTDLTIYTQTNDVEASSFDADDLTGTTLKAFPTAASAFAAAAQTIDEIISDLTASQETAAMNFYDAISAADEATALSLADALKAAQQEITEEATKAAEATHPGDTELLAERRREHFNRNLDRAKAELLDTLIRQATEHTQTKRRAEQLAHF